MPNEIKRLHGNVINAWFKEIESEDGECVDAVLELHYEDGRLVTLLASAPVNERYYVEMSFLTDEEKDEYQHDGSTIRYKDD